MSYCKAIAINDDYRIMVEQNYFTLQKHQTEKYDNKLKQNVECDIWCDMGFYSNVYMCLYKLINDVEIKSDDTITSVVERMEDIFKQLKKVGEQIEKGR